MHVANVSESAGVPSSRSNDGRAGPIPATSTPIHSSQMVCAEQNMLIGGGSVDFPALPPAPSTPYQGYRGYSGAGGDEEPELDRLGELVPELKSMPGPAAANEFDSVFRPNQPSLQPDELGELDELDELAELVSRRASITAPSQGPPGPPAAAPKKQLQQPGQRTVGLRGCFSNSKPNFKSAFRVKRAASEEMRFRLARSNSGPTPSPASPVEQTMIARSASGPALHPAAPPPYSPVEVVPRSQSSSSCPPADAPHSAPFEIDTAGPLLGSEISLDLDVDDLDLEVGLDDIGLGLVGLAAVPARVPAPVGPRLPAATTAMGVVPLQQQLQPKKKHFCKICGKGFVSASKLQRHQPVHTGARQFKCQLCPADYTQKGGLKAHTMKHIRFAMEGVPGAPPIVGDVVNGFSLKSLLKCKPVGGNGHANVPLSPITTDISWGSIPLQGHRHSAAWPIAAQPSLPMAMFSVSG